jgi:hypothetical protein
MVPGRIGCEVAVLAVLCVAAIFFFPAIQGPYPVVHGPVTAILAARAALRLHISIMHAALSSPYLISPLALLARMALSGIDFPPTATPESSAILRC